MLIQRAGVRRQSPDTDTCRQRRCTSACRHPADCEARRLSHAADASYRTVGKSYIFILQTQTPLGFSARMRWGLPIRSCRLRVAGSHLRHQAQQGRLWRACSPGRTRSLATQERICAAHVPWCPPSTWPTWHHSPLRAKAKCSAAVAAPARAVVAPPPSVLSGHLCDNFSTSYVAPSAAGQQFHCSLWEACLLALLNAASASARSNSPI